MNPKQRSVMDIKKQCRAALQIEHVCIYNAIKIADRTDMQKTQLIRQGTCVERSTRQIQ